MYRAAFAPLFCDGYSGAQNEFLDYVHGRTGRVFVAQRGKKIVGFGAVQQLKDMDDEWRYYLQYELKMAANPDKYRPIMLDHLNKKRASFGKGEVKVEFYCHPLAESGYQFSMQDVLFDGFYVVPHARRKGLGKPWCRLV